MFSIFSQYIKNTCQIIEKNSFAHPINEGNSEKKILKLLVLESFKTEPCRIPSPHNHKQCNLYHNDKDRKRKGEFYSVDLCEFIEQNQICPYGDACLKSHSGVEQLYRQDKYKKKFCSHYPFDINNCEYGEFCSFAHEEEELLIELLHRLEKNKDFFIFKFKTAMCPFNYLSHDKAQCVYAHNWQDFRRKPDLFQYEPIECPHWKPNKFLTIYHLGCPFGYQCHQSHGWKEYDYHPLIYKTKFCTKGIKCQRKFECPYYHSESEKRVVEKNVKIGTFRFSPKNIYAEEILRNKEKSHKKIVFEKKNSLGISDFDESPMVDKSETRIPSSNETLRQIDYFSSEQKMTQSLRFNSRGFLDTEINEINEFEQFSLSLNEIYLGNDTQENTEEKKN